MALLRLAMTNAPLWLLDEPFIALDEGARELIADCMSRHLQQGGSIIMTSHQSLQLLGGNHQEYYLS